MDNVRLVPQLGYCIASNKVAIEKQKVRFMYRDIPDNNDDSGWRFFSGNEDDDYSNNPNNLGIYDVNTIAKTDASIILYLESPIGSAFEREDAEGVFIEIKGFVSSKLN